MQEDWPKVVREWRGHEPQEGWGAWVTVALCALVAVALLCSGCAVSVGVSGVTAAMQVDPGKLAPLVKQEEWKR